MPKIDADSVAEHVARQEGIVFQTAIELFVERGYSNVRFGDIASAVGLARNSMYRYFPSKAAILVRWFRAELPAQVVHSAAILGGDGPPVDRILRWADDQLDYACRPEHALIAALSGIVPDVDDETRRELETSHDQLMAPLRDTLRQAGFTRASARDASVDLIAGMVLVAAQREARVGRDRALRAQLARAIKGVVAG
jgi:AcrR family transcriptional regulator